MSFANIVAFLAGVLPSVVEMAKGGDSYGTTAAVGAGLVGAVKVTERVIKKRRAGAPTYRTGK